MISEWSLYGHCSRGSWVVVGPFRYVRLHGFDPIPVTVRLSEEGCYLGWIKAGESEPCMILRAEIFEVQFPYGSAAEVRRGRGSVVCLEISTR